MLKRHQILLLSVTVIGTVLLTFVAVAEVESKVFHNPTIDGIPIGTVLKGADGLDPNQEKIGAERFCRYKKYERASSYLVGYAEDEDKKGTMQWDAQAIQWWYCPGSYCTTYFKTVTCERGSDE